MLHLFIAEISNEWPYTIGNNSNASTPRNFFVWLSFFILKAPEL
jgi:hypothetical protein